MVVHDNGKNTDNGASHGNAIVILRRRTRDVMAQAEGKKGLQGDKQEHHRYPSRPRQSLFRD